jgi:hypothetical protein
MTAFLANWKTSLPGLLALATVIWNAWQTKTISWEDLQTALIGVGLIAAKDFNVLGIPHK